MKTLNGRTTEYNIDDQFLKRYSPRAFSGESITKNELMTLFDAARWAPSASNIQPWRFIYTLRDTPAFETLFSTLMEGNKIWCVKASALILVISSKIRIDKDGNKKESPTHSFDTGAAWENFALQASEMNLIAHGMAGFDYEKAKTEFGIPEDYVIEMMIALGKPGKIEDLPEPLQTREAPSDRKPLNEIIFENSFSQL